jgi:hypothetical protein
VELINLQQTIFSDSRNFPETKFHGYLLQQKPRHLQQSCWETDSFLDDYSGSVT